MSDSVMKRIWINATHQFHGFLYFGFSFFREIGGCYDQSPHGCREHRIRKFGNGFAFRKRKTRENKNLKFSVKLIEIIIPKWIQVKIHLGPTMVHLYWVKYSKPAPSNGSTTNTSVFSGFKVNALSSVIQNGLRLFWSHCSKASSRSSEQVSLLLPT